MISSDQALETGNATRLLAGIVVPDTPIVTRAIEYAREHCEPYLFNHVMRSWLFDIDSSWQVALSLNNALDEIYYESIGLAPFDTWYGEPRNVTLRIDGRY